MMKMRCLLLVFSPRACEAILSKWPNSPSGYYSRVNVNGHNHHVHCGYTVTWRLFVVKVEVG